MKWGKPTKNIKKKDPRHFLKESSLSRVYEHIMEYDTAGLTAFRDNPLDNSKCSDSAVPEESSEERALKINLRRNKELKATLLSLGYGVTKVMGAYIEGFKSEVAKEVSEQSFFVANLQGDPAFFDNMKMLGEKFCQDSVLLVPKGGKGAYLYGTNNSEFPGYGESFEAGDFKGGEEAEFMSRVDGRPYTFTEDLDEEVLLETIADHGRNSRWVIRKMADKILKS
jgi:hypothetical protein